MESTTTDQKFFGAEASLSEPHFDEEATLLSAQPVVPLAAVNGSNGARPASVKGTLPHPWILGIALVGAVLVGIFATAFYYSGSDRNDPTTFDESAVAAGVAADSTSIDDSFSGPAVAEPAVNAVTSAEDKTQAPAKNQPVRAAVEPAKKPAARLVSVIRDRDSDSNPEESREDRKAARKQARQERRRAERGRREERSSDDVLRIRDIFEGSPRP